MTDQDEDGRGSISLLRNVLSCFNPQLISCQGWAFVFSKK